MTTDELVAQRAHDVCAVVEQDLEPHDAMAALVIAMANLCVRHQVPAGQIAAEVCRTAARLTVARTVNRIVGRCPVCKRSPCWGGCDRG